MIRTTLPVQSQTITWLHEGVVDWASAGRYYTPDGADRELGFGHFNGMDFDAAVSSVDGRYTLIYTRLGTKGLLLKQGELLREVNRSYYQAQVYEYPAGFFEFEGRTYLAHCPQEYNRLDFEDVETGEIPTDVSGRQPADVFHSRFAVSPEGTYLLSTGWLWHPWDIAQAFDIRACFQNPLLLDEGAYDNELRPAVSSEISSGSFLNDYTVLLSSSNEPPFDDDEVNLPPSHVVFWNLRTGELTQPVKMQGKFGNVVAIDEDRAWDLHQHPKLIDLRTGVVVEQWPDIDLGRQNSSIHPNTEVQIVVSPDRRTVVIRLDNQLEFIGL
ncbi:hypothetical protein [Hymenobacter chitinivorans]|uniref:Uncharacterized protein n=1 Tax=Hymenobacter chitinivorans DSM 11115 TaxID=1121954 RepID=A0A2M9BLF3_9BACT|nr:hypothetical protein [Hymenobacter chitinivorans]PJJ58773.1 hypothetical protein CLV45_0183 [Hymenobacter chitinivorans DSM 11115]